jgi:hypothetical protein
MRNCTNCGVAPDVEHKWYCVTKGHEHIEPEKHCRAPTCKDTNWGGYARLHGRGSDCPPYSANPEPNPMAEFWEGLREMARETGQMNATFIGREQQQ